MSLNLEKTLAWTKSLEAKTPDAPAELAMLNDLQGNILKGHGRRFTAHLFLAFDNNQSAVARATVRAFGQEVTTALDQLTDAQVYRTTGADGRAFISFFLTAAGYRALGVDQAMPDGQAFAAGMNSRPLADPPSAQWEPALAADVHAMLLIGAASEPELSVVLARCKARIAETGGALSLLGVEYGKAITNDDKNNIEHFGYVDGRSQPLALQEDVDREAEYGGIDLWNPSIPLSQLLVKCPGGQLEVSHGSYFVFRKLEQNVQGFKRREIDLAEILPGAGERAGASVVGRFENGTPVTMSATEIPVKAKGDAGLPNNFNYADDPDGLKCPFVGHIRKTNPRTPETDTDDDSKIHLMARRGSPYGDQISNPQKRLDIMPTGGVRLLFMAYQSNIENQFEFTQHMWANNSDFLNPDTGIDPIIGQPAHAGSGRYPKKYGVSLSEPFNFSGYVTMRGGEYFFAPSISFLKHLH